MYCTCKNRKNYYRVSDEHTTAFICSDCNKEIEHLNKQKHISTSKFCPDCLNEVGSKTICDTNFDECDSADYCFDCERYVEGEELLTQADIDEMECTGCGLPNKDCKCTETNNKVDEMKDGSAVFI